MSQGNAGEGNGHAADALSSSQNLSRMMSQGRSFSGNERHCMYLNTGRRTDSGAVEFANIAAVAGLDFPEDGRAIATVDWDHDGDLDIWISNRTAPRLRLMRNDQDSGNHFVTFRLQGNGSTTSRDAIGARVEIEFPGSDDSSDQTQRLIKELRAGEGFLSQSSKWVHFGIGNIDQISKVVVRWPGGEEEEFCGVNIDHRYQLVQGTGVAEISAELPREIALRPAKIKLAEPTQTARLPLKELLPVPNCDYREFDGSSERLLSGRNQITLVNIWSGSCPTCREELQRFQAESQALKDAGIRVVALTVDEFGAIGNEESAAERFAAEQQFSFSVGYANAEVLATFKNLHDRQLSLHRELPIPCSFLIDSERRMALIYKGPFAVDQLIADATEYSEKNRWQRYIAGAQFDGLDLDHPHLRRTAERLAARTQFTLAFELQQAGKNDSARQLYESALELRPNFAMAHNNLGMLMVAQGRNSRAIAYYRRAIELAPGFPDAYVNLGNVLLAQATVDEAESQFETALRINPKLAEAHVSMGMAQEYRGNSDEAIQSYLNAIEINPDISEAHNNLGATYARLGRMSEAIKHFEKAVGLSPNNGKARRNLELARMQHQ